MLDRDRNAALNILAIGLNRVAHILHLTIKIAATGTKPADAGYRTPDLTLVRAPSGLGLFRRDFNRSGLVQDMR